MAAAQTNHGGTNWIAAIEGFLLLNLGAMLLGKTWYGQLPLYIHPRYTPLVLVTSFVLVLLGAVRLWQVGDIAPGGTMRIGVYGLLLAPLALGVLVPVKPAGSALVDPSQLNKVGRSYRPAPTMAVEQTEQWTLLDWMFARFTLTPEQIEGKPVEVVGFVFRNADTPPDELFVIRYTLACCVADRSGVALPVKVAPGIGFPNDQWVRVTGVIDTRPANGPPELFVVDAHVEPIAQPDEPYLYP